MNKREEIIELNEKWQEPSRPSMGGGKLSKKEIKIMNEVIERMKKEINRCKQ
jgi:hypothetical protein